MRNFYQSQIEQAASVAGLSSVLINPEDPSDLALPLPRIDVTWLKEKYTRIGKKIAVSGDEKNRKLKAAVYRAEQGTTVSIMTDDKGSLDEMAKQFLLALPKTCADPQGNVVTCSVNQAEWGGFSSELVEVLKTWSKAYHITFTRLITKEVAHPWMKDVSPSVRQENNRG